MQPWAVGSIEWNGFQDGTGRSIGARKNEAGWVTIHRAKGPCMHVRIGFGLSRPCIYIRRSTLTDLKHVGHVCSRHDTEVVPRKRK
jgi:hypothetical protein